jgi:hypothetical protein
MIATDDPTQCNAVIDRAARYFKNRANSPQVARSCLNRTYQKHIGSLRMLLAALCGGAVIIVPVMSLMLEDDCSIRVILSPYG